jgi:hypothetical protein
LLRLIGKAADMQMDRIRPFAVLPPQTAAWLDLVFSAKAVEKGGVVRRSVASVESEIGRAFFIAEVQRRGFHCVECGGQMIVICNRGQMQVIC